MNSQVAIELGIGSATVFLSCMGSAVIIGMFFGGLKTEMRVMADRLAKIEGMFTLVPRPPGHPDP